MEASKVCHVGTGVLLDHREQADERLDRVAWGQEEVGPEGPAQWSMNALIAVLIDQVFRRVAEREDIADIVQQDEEVFGREVLERGSRAPRSP